MSDGHIQSVAGTVGTNPQTVTLSGVAAGSRIVVFACGGSGVPTSPTVSDSQGSYTLVGSGVGPDSNSVWVGIYELKNANSGSHVITFDASGANNVFPVAVETAGHVSTTSTMNGADQSNPGTGANALSSGSITITNDCTVISLLVDSNSTNTSDEPTAGTSPFTFASRLAGANAAIGAYRVQTAAGSSSGAATGTAITGTDTFVTMGVAVPNGVASSTEQEGFRARNDDGSETTATWIASQDTNFTGPLDSNARIRFLINAGGDPAAIAYQLEYKLHAGSTYIKAEPPGGGSLATGTAGTTGTGGTTTCNVPYPATPATGDMLIAVVGNRPNANTPDDIAGWTKVSSTGGAGSEGAGVGTIRNTIYYKEALGTESGNLAVACTSGTSMFGTMFKYSKTTGKKWSVAVVHGPDNSAGTSWSATAASDPGLAANDFLICASINSEDTARAASEAVTATGCTFGAMSEKHDAGITTGNDLSMVVADFPVSTGPSSAAPVFTMTMSGTNSANSAGCTAFIRIRQVDQPIQIATSGNIAAGGEATTAQLTAPSGKSTSDFDTGRMWDDENGTDTIDITTDNYTEVEWCIKALSSGGAANADVYDLRVTKAGTAMDTYSVSPQWTIGASDISTGLGGSALTMGAGTQGPGIAVPL